VSKESTIKYLRLLGIFGVIGTLCACSNPLPFHQDRSYTDNLLIDTNAVAIYPNNIEIYTLNDLPTKPYTVVDNFKVSTYNQYGSKLQRAAVKTYLQSEAVKLGGNGVIELGSRGKFDYAQAIQFVDADK
jgi:hypothetical protein